MSKYPQDTIHQLEHGVGHLHAAAAELHLALDILTTANDIKCSAYVVEAVSLHRKLTRGHEEMSQRLAHLKAKHKEAPPRINNCKSRTVNNEQQ